MMYSQGASLPLAPGHATLTDGVWGAAFDRSRATTVPTMRDDLFDADLSHAVENFRVAAGRAEGSHEGPPFLDGDLYKWLEAAAATLAHHPDPELDATLDELIALIGSAQRPDGYIHTPTLIAERARDGDITLADRLNFETYNLGHLMTAGCLHHEATGKDSLLGLGVRAAEFIISLVDNNPDLIARSAICPSHYMGTVELYRTTGDERFLQLAKDLVRLRDLVATSGYGGDDNQDRVPLAGAEHVVGHAVRANYLYAGLADLLLESPNPDLAARLERLWDDVATSKVYLTGGHGALYDGASPDGYPWQGEITKVHQSYGRPYQLPHTTAHNETCATIGNILWAWRMLLRTGEVRYADAIDVAVNNTLLASIGLDGASYFYTNPLRQVAGLPYPLRRAGDTALDPVPAPPPSDERLRQRYLSCFCCPPNIARTLARLPEYCYSATTDGLQVHQFASGTATAEVDGGTLALAQATDYPRDGRVVVTVTAAPSGAATIAVRVPGWADGATLTVNGADSPATPGTYAELTRTWAVGDEIALDLPMRVRKIVAHRLVEEATNQVAVQRGPVVHCLETHDLPDGVRPGDVLLPRSATFTERTLTIAGNEVVALEAEALVRPVGDPDALYAELTTADPRPVTVRLIPYYAWANRGPSEMTVWLPVAW